MLFKMTILLFSMVVLLAGGGDNLPSQGKKLGDTPPQPMIKVDGKALEVYQSSYCWNSRLKGTRTCADYASPSDMLKDKSKEQVKANEPITFKFDAKAPTEMTLSQIYNGTATQERLNGNTILSPQEQGIYYYILSAVWLKGSISEGDSSYAFAIEVVDQTMHAP